MSYKQTYDEVSARKRIGVYYEDVEMPGGYKHNLPNTLKMIDLYYNSKYKTGAYDSLGYRKFFDNIVKPACDIATKFIDIDTKDLPLIPEGAHDEENEFRVWLYQRRLRQWLKDSNFGKTLNEHAFNKPKYGTVVMMKDADGKWCRINLHLLRFDSKVECLKDSEFVYRLSSMSRTDIIKKTTKGYWMKEAVDELFDRGDDMSYMIYDCLDKTEEGYHRTIRADLFTTMKKGGVNRAVESEINDENLNYAGALTLFEEDIKPEDFPYREDHWEKVPGRWLGYGFVEYLEENQIAINEAENLERKGLMFSSLHIWQTRDENVGGSNMLSAAQNGDILKVESEVTKVDMAERNLAAFNNTRANWTRSTERKTFTTDITTGANLPSRTPLGVANLQAQLASSFFELKREDSGLFFKQLILEDIIPSFEKENDKAHVLTFMGSDEEIDRLDGMLTKMYMNQAVMDYAETHGYFPSQMEKDRVRQQITEQIKKNKNRYLNIPKGYYKNAKYFIDVMVTGESVDNGAKSQVIQLALQIMGTNPGILQNPVTKKFFLYLLSLGGISSVDLGLFDPQPEPQQQPQQPQQPQQMMGQGGQPLQPGGSVSMQPAQAGMVTQTKTY